jgi:site-specific recombinase XerD
MGIKRRIGLREIAGLQAGTTVWDTDVAGFGARRQKSSSVSYIVFYRTAEGRQRVFTLGRHGSPWTPETARKEAKRVLGLVAAGADPSEEKQSRRHAEDVSQLCDMYLADAKAGRVLSKRKVPKKVKTLVTDESRIERHIKPLLGKRSVKSITRSDVEAFMYSVAEGKTAKRAPTGKKRGLSNVRGGKGAATRTVGLLGAIFAYAVRRGMRNDNPVRGVERFADNRRLRRLADEEYSSIGKAHLRAASETAWPPLIAAAQFMMITGWRSGEVIGLKWNELDLSRRLAVLGDTKTGQSVRPLSRAACDILREQSTKEGLVFAAARGLGVMSGFARVWGRIVQSEALPRDVTPHVLRHSFASLAHDLGYSEPTIAALLGHKGRSVTSRYIHAADAVLLAAADAVANRTLSLMGMRPTSEVIEFRPSTSAA